MDDGNLARPEPFGEVLGAPIKARHTADLGRCSAFAQQGGKSHVAVHPPTRATWVLKYQRTEKFLTSEATRVAWSAVAGRLRLSLAPRRALSASSTPRA